jgi:hypothetical protein
MLKLITVGILSNIPSALCIASAVYLAFHDKPGWGWFLLLAAITAHSVSYRSKRRSE